MKNSYKKYLAFALAATMLFSTCGTTAAPETPAESNKPAQTTPSTTTPAAPEAPAAEEEDKYQLEDIVIARTSSNDVGNFNILNTMATSDLAALANMTDGLLESDPDGKLVPCLAEDWGTEDGGKTWTFHLRKGVKWVDINGNEKGDTKAQDFVTSLEWVLNFHKNDSTNTSMPISLIEGAGEYYEYTKALSQEEAYALTTEPGSKFAEMVGIETPDDYTVIYHCLSEKPYFDSVGCYACLYPMAQGLIDELGIDGVKAMDNTNYWYNGPYLMKSYTQGSEQYYEQNPTYWDTECHRFNSVTVRIVDSNETAYLLFENGEIDHIDLTESNLKTIYDDPNHKFHDNLVEQRKAPFSYQLHWNYDRRNESDGTPDTNWNYAISNEAFRKSVYFGFDQVEYMKRTNFVNPYSCENNYITIQNLVYTSDGTEYTELVKSNLDHTLADYNGESMMRLNKELAEQYKAQAIEELTALGVEFPVHLKYHIKGANQTSLDTATVLKNSLEESLGSDYIQMDIVTYISSFSQEVNDPRYHSMVILGWDGDFADPKAYHSIEIAGTKSAMFADNMKFINDVIAAGPTPATEELIKDYQTYTELIHKADAINDDLDARYEAFAEAEAYALNNALFHPSTYKVNWCLTKINPYSRMNAMYGSVNDKMKNWETSAEPYTTEQMAELAK